MITTNVLQRIFNIASGEGEGTAFTIDVDNRQYLVTARHLVKDFIGGKLDVFHDGNFVPLEFELVGHGAGEIDVSVLAPKAQLSPTFSLPPTTKGMILGQNAYF